MKSLKIIDGSPDLVEVQAGVTGANDVLVDVAAVGVSRDDFTALANPGVTPGRRFAGTVAAVGHAVTGFAVGDVVVSAPPGACGACGACLRGDDAYCARAEVLYAGIRPGVDADGGLAGQVNVSEKFLALAPELDLAVAAFACDTGVHAMHALRSAGDAITAGNTVAVLGTSALAACTRVLLDVVAAVEVLAISDYSAENQAQVLADFAHDGIAAVLVMDRTQQACDFATAIAATGSAIVLAANGTGEALVQPMPVMRYEASVRAVEYANRADLIELLKVLKLSPLEVEHERVCLDEFASFDADRLAAIEPGLVVVV